MVEQTGALTMTTPSDREIVMTRVFDDPYFEAMGGEALSTLILEERARRR